MGRCGYSTDDDDSDNWEMIKWRGQVASAIRGKRGQSFLRELLDGLDAMPEKRLIANDLEAEGSFCAIGVVGAKRGVDLAALDPENYDTIASTFGIAQQLVREIEYINDEGVGSWAKETPEQRWQRVRDWCARQLKDAASGC